MATAQTLKEFVGFGSINKSLGRPPKPYCSTKLKPLGAIGQNNTIVIYGDEATPDFTDTIDILFGDTVPVVWDNLTIGYSYVWNIGRKLLTITDDKEMIVSTRSITAWCDLAVSAEVLESHQFAYVIDGSYTADVFVIATRQMTIQNSSMMLVQWGEFERTLSMICHVAYTRLQSWFIRDMGADDYRCNGAVENLRSFIQVLLVDLAQSGIFPQNLQVASISMNGAPVQVNKTATLTAIGQSLMLYTLSASLLLGDRHCYEPWMLWTMFKWLQRTNHIEIEDKIFDLSPNWGA